MAHQPLGGRPVGVVRAHKDVPFSTEDPEVMHIEPAISDDIVDHEKIQKVAYDLGISPAQVVLGDLVI
jgi:hypothetical protein